MKQNRFHISKAVMSGKELDDYLDSEKVKRHVSGKQYLDPFTEEPELLQAILNRNNGDFYVIEREEHMQPLLSQLDVLSKKIFEAFKVDNGNNLTENQWDSVHYDMAINTLVAVSNLIFRHFGISCDDGEHALKDVITYYIKNKNNIKTQYDSELRLIHLKKTIGVK